MLKLVVLVAALAMAATASAASRTDPYRSYRFRLVMNGHPVAGANQLTRAGGEVVKHRAGGDPSSSRKAPGRNKFEAITLERGVTHDAGFASWAAKGSAGAHASLKVLGPAGAAQGVYRNCWTSEYRALPKLGGASNAIAIEHIKLQCEAAGFSGRR
jgi:phage tail-like protein